MIAYLAEPMDFAHGADRDEANAVARQLTSLGFSVYRPAMAWLGPATRPDHVTADVVRTNREILDGADLVVAVLPSSVRSIGVPMEIAWATEQGTPVVLLTDIDGSAMLAGNPLIVQIGRVDQLDAGIGRALRPLAGRGVAGAADPPERLLFQQIHDEAAPPARAHADDAGFDLTSVEAVTIKPGEFRFVPCGLRVALPPDTFGWIVARSSTMPRWGLVVTPGVVDAGFRGELGVPVYRASGWPFAAAPTEPDDDAPDDLYRVPAGTRLAQLVPLPNTARRFAGVWPTDALPAARDGRGDNGFGSTGT